MTAPDRTTDALASALPADDYGRLTPKDARELAHIQAERLAEAGYVLVHTAPDEATIERLAMALYTADGDDPAQLEILPPPLQRAAWNRQRRHAKAVLAALADTSAQARHTDDNATGGGEHG